MNIQRVSMMVNGDWGESVDRIIVKAEKRENKSVGGLNQGLPPHDTQECSSTEVQVID